MRRLDSIRGAAALALAAGLLFWGADARALSTADLLQFPIDGADAQLDLSRDVEPIWQGDGYSFSLTRIGVYNPSGNRPTASDPATWTLIAYQASVTFLPGFDPNDSYEADDRELLLVVTSLRQGDWAASQPLPPRINGGILLPTIADDDHLFVYDPPGGSVTDDEGSQFLAFRLAALPGVTQTFSYGVALRESLTGTLQHFNRGYLTRPVPEPQIAIVAVSLLIGACVARRGFRR